MMKDTPELNNDHSPNYGIIQDIEEQRKLPPPGALNQVGHDIVGITGKLPCK